MKKTVIAVAAFFCAIAALFTISIFEKYQISELTKANIEALAYGTINTGSSGLNPSTGSGGSGEKSACYGPKRTKWFGDTSVCKCKNTTPCMDNTGCTASNN